MCFGQLATIDAGANAQVAGNNALTKAISGLAKIQSNLNNDALLEAVKTSSTVTRQFELINEVYSVSSGMGKLKRVKDFFTESSQTANDVSTLNSYLANDKTKTLSTADRSTVKIGIDLCLDDLKLAMETMQFAIDPLNKLSVAERLKEFENASTYLERSNLNLEESKSIVYRAKIAREKREKRDFYYDRKYGIKN
jgi:hypothetical protein